MAAGTISVTFCLSGSAGSVQIPAQNMVINLYIILSFCLNYTFRSKI